MLGASLSAAFIATTGIAASNAQDYAAVNPADGKVAEKDREAGETQCSGPTTHALENIGANDQHALVVELKK